MPTLILIHRGGRLRTDHASEIISGVSGIVAHEAQCMAFASLKFATLMVRFAQVRFAHFFITQRRKDAKTQRFAKVRKDSLRSLFASLNRNADDADLAGLRGFFCAGTKKGMVRIVRFAQEHGDLLGLRSTPALPPVRRGGWLTRKSSHRCCFCCSSPSF